MSKMLTFLDSAWISALEASQAGRRDAALAFLRPLLADGVPTKRAVLAHRLAARVHLDAEQYAQARKHLRTASRLDPYDAEIHFEIGVAFEDDPYGCDRRAARRFREAESLNTAKAKYKAHLGRALVRLNRTRAGVAALREAAEFAEGDAAVLKVVVGGLCDACRAVLAWKVVLSARFQAPADKAVRRLCDEVKFARARQATPAGRVRWRTAGPKVLPFLSVAGEGRRVGTVRRDTGSVAVPHLGRLRAYQG